MNATEARRDGVRIAKLMIRAAEKTRPRHRPGPRPTFDWAACGTPAQSKKHYRHGIPMCEACRRAENRRTQDSRKKLSKVPGNRRGVMIL